MNHTFDYIKEELGLEDFAPHTLTVPSPFRYEEQVKLMVPTDIPLIKEVKEEEYIREISQQLKKDCAGYKWKNTRTIYFL